MSANMTTDLTIYDWEQARAGAACSISRLPPGLLATFCSSTSRHLALLTTIFFSIRFPLGYPVPALLLQAFASSAADRCPGLYAADLSTAYYGIGTGAVLFVLTAGFALHFFPGPGLEWPLFSWLLSTNPDAGVGGTKLTTTTTNAATITTAKGPALLEEALTAGYRTRLLPVAALFAQAALACAGAAETLTTINAKVLDELAVLLGWLFVALHVPLLARTLVVLIVSTLAVAAQLLLDFVVVPALVWVRCRRGIRCAPELARLLDSLGRLLVALSALCGRVPARFRTWVMKKKAVAVVEDVEEDKEEDRETLLDYFVEGYVVFVVFLIAQTVFLLLLGLFKPQAIRGATWLFPGVQAGEIVWMPEVRMTPDGVTFV